MLFVSHTNTNMDNGRKQCLRQRTKQSRKEQSLIIRKKKINRRGKRKEKTEKESDGI